MIEEQEDGVCVCCRAAADLVFELGKDSEVPVCSECREDGSFMRWLEREMEDALTKAGYVSSLAADGRRCWDRPKPARSAGLSSEAAAHGTSGGRSMGEKPENHSPWG
jgi:NMD protein affecting ribosome stability and mRNA decay